MRRKHVRVLRMGAHFTLQAYALAWPAANGWLKDDDGTWRFTDFEWGQWTMGVITLESGASPSGEMSITMIPARREDGRNRIGKRRGAGRARVVAGTCK
jgi:hypothetical protein